ncbi:MAG: TIM-barrel domain-containing protein [Bacteroidales bacterium]
MKQNRRIKEFRKWTMFLRVIYPLLLLFMPAANSGIKAQNKDELDISNYCSEIIVNGNIKVSLYTHTMFRVRTSELKGEKFPPKYEIPFLIGKLSNWKPVSFSQKEDNEYHYIETDRLQIRISKRDWSWTVWTPGGGKQIYPSAGKIYGMFKDGYSVFDNASAFDERNKNSRFSHWFYNPATQKYTDIYLFEDLIFDKYFIYGPDYPSLFSQFNELVGPEPMLPIKGYGFFQTQHIGCSGNQEKLLELARKLRERDIPCDNLIIDFEWGDGCPGEDEKYWGQSLDWSPAYSNPLTPKQMIAKLDSMHFNVMLIHHSAPDFSNRELDTRRRPGDWTSKVYPENVWWEKYREKLDIGVSGTWQDTRQNDLTDGLIWSWTQNYIGPEKRVLFLGCRKMMDLNPFELERDNTIPANDLIGSRRYPFRWTEDVSNTYRELKWHVNGITNTHGSMKGVNYITADCFGKNWKVQARWNQFIDFNSVSRSHTSKPWEIITDFGALAEIMNFRKNEVQESPSLEKTDPLQNNKEVLAKTGQTAEPSVRIHRKLRYRLIPYLYSTAFVNYLTGYPISRPLLLAFPNDLHCNKDQWPLQYMFGENFLVVPVYADFNSMEIYLPEGSTWIDYWDKAVYKGGQVIDYNTSDIEKLPLFVRSGSIIPMRKEQNWLDTGEIWDPLTLDIYPDSTSSFILYEDDKRTTYYQKGEFSKTTISCQADPSGTEIKIGEAAGDYKGKPESRKIVLQVNLVDKTPAQVQGNKCNMVKCNNLDGINEAKCGWLYDKETRRVLIIVETKTSESTIIQIIK